MWAFFLGWIGVSSARAASNAGLPDGVKAARYQPRRGRPWAAGLILAVFLLAVYGLAGWVGLVAVVVALGALIGVGVLIDRHQPTERVIDREHGVIAVRDPR